MTASPSRLRSRIDAVVIGASAGGVEALSRAAAGAAGDAARAGVRRPAPAARAAEPAGRTSSRPGARCRCARPRTRSRSSRARSTSRRRTTTCWSTTGRSSRSRPTSRCTSRGRRSTCCSNRPRTSTAERLLGIILTGAQRGRRRGLAAVHRAGGVTVVQEPDERAGAAHGRGGAAAQVRPTWCCRSSGSPTLSADRTGRWPQREPMRMRSHVVQVPARRRPRGEPAGAGGAAAPRRPRAAPRRAPAPRRSSCCWCTTSRWRCSTCRCRTWTASSWPS